MHKCPHCQQETISNFKKILSVNTFTPVICPDCHEQAYTHIVYGLLALTGWIILTWVFIGLAYMSQTSFILLGTIPALFLVADKFLLKSPLQAIYQEQ